MKLRYVASIASVLGVLFSLNLSQEARANVADDLNANYNNDTVKNCGTANRPAFLCSGNLIRFTSNSHSYHTWEPSPSSVNGGGVSFIYLRKDFNVKPLIFGKTSGMIFYPSMLKPASKARAEVMCAFPGDGWTAQRTTSSGMCGPTIYYPASKSCQSQGITTFKGWKSHFLEKNKPGDIEYNNNFKHQCGFYLAIGQQNTANIFNENIEATKFMYSLYTDKDGNNLVNDQNTHNEIVIKTWVTKNGGVTIPAGKLPIQAFFYLVNDSGESGLADAQYFQQDYYNVTGNVVPVVKLDAKIPNDMKYSYNAGDQVVTDIANQ